MRFLEDWIDAQWLLRQLQEAFLKSLSQYWEAMCSENEGACQGLR